jgi:hypothetical protein
LTSHFWGIYEVDFPEDADVKAPEECFAPLEPFLFSSFIRRKGGKRNEENGFFRMPDSIFGSNSICPREG